MISLGEAVVIVVTAAWVFGPNELPRIARAAGRFTGQATGFLYRTRARLFQFAEETEMTKLHQEMQATMHQLHAIRSELRGGMNIFDPGPLAQRAMGSMKPVPGRGAGAGVQAQPQQAQQQQHEAPVGTSVAHLQQRQPPAAGSWAASPVQAVDGAPLVATQLPQTAQQQLGQAGGEGYQHPLTMPVSAVAAGWAPDRAGSTPSGSEVLLDALAEERIAAQLLRLQQQQRAAAAVQQGRPAAPAGAAQQAGAAAPATAASDKLR